MFNIVYVITSYDQIFCYQILHEYIFYVRSDMQTECLINI